MPERQIRHPARPPRLDPVPGWSQSLFTGACGIALLHIERARAGTGTWTAAHEWIAATVRHPIVAHPDASGLHHGAPAVAYTLHTANQPAYADALGRLDQHIEEAIRSRLHRAHHRIDIGQLPTLAEYDLIRGLTGIGAYLLHRQHHSQLLRDVLAYLVHLTHPLSTAGHRLPGWWTLNAPNDRPSPHWPGGHANLGLAHGISGPLALLSLTHRAGIRVPGHEDTIGRICSWLDQWQQGTGDRAWWPETVTRAEHRTGTSRQPGPARPSWCYGTPGITRAQQLAALATGDSHRRRQAERALAGCLTDAHQLEKLTDNTLCHGWTGLIHTAARVAADAEDPEFLSTAHLRTRCCGHADHNQVPHRDGLLEGRTGHQLARHTATAATPTAWDRALLLTGPTTAALAPRSTTDSTEGTA